MSQAKLKICGVQTADEARQLAELGVDYIGLNFVPTSSRLITIETAEAIVEAVRDSQVQTVALFRDQPLDMVNDYAHRLGIDYVQLHGSESTDYAHQVEAPVIKAIAVNSAQPTTQIKDFINSYPADYFVLDRHQQGRGEAVDFRLAREIAETYPDKIFLAGGLSPDNLADVLKVVQPYGIDIASGVRTDSILDMAKIADCLKFLGD